MTDLPLLRATGVSHTFQGPHGEVRAVNRVDLTAHAADLVAISGRSGCGKTTLLLVLGGLLAPQRGTVRVHTHDLYDLPPNRRSACRAANIGYVFQDFHLIPYLTVLDNVLVPALAGAGKPDLRDRASALLEQFQLGHRFDHVPATLSAGEQQRVALARALVLSPRVLLADEPTGNLDPENGGIVLDALAEFARDGGAVILVTHDPDALQVAARHLHMTDGSFQDE